MKHLKHPPLSISLTVRDAAKAIAFYREAFGAEELYRLVDPKDGKIGHAEILVNGALVMLADEYPEFNASPDQLGGTTVRVSLMVDDVDAAFRRAIEAGATSRIEPSDQFYGHRSGRVADPFGHEWILSKEIESLPPVEMQRRWNEMEPKG